MPCRRSSLRLPNGCLSPMAFNPAPRSSATPSHSLVGSSSATTAGAQPGGGRLLLPSQEQPITFMLLWEQQVAVDAGMFPVIWAAQL